MGDLMRAAVSAVVLCALAPATPAAAKGQTPLRPGARYVAMGSSFASGAGIAPYDAGAPARCQRSTENYAHQLASKRKLNLVDVTCGGATTAHVLGPWNELPPQIEAVTPDTALVTLTIGGNDVGYIGGLIAASCGDGQTAAATGQPLCRMIAPARRGGSALPAPTEEGWRALETAMTRMVQEIHRRAPRARVIFVDYLTVVPAGSPCAQTPISPQVAEAARATATRLARLTAQVARSNGAQVIRASELSRGRHDACAAAPWIAGFIPPPQSGAFVPYHPNLAGMSALAEALDRQLGH